MENKVLGLEVSRYIKISYMFILITSGAGVLSNLFALGNMYPFGSLGLIIGIMGIVGVLMAVVGWIGFKDKFSETDISHFIFFVMLFVAFFVLGMIFGNLLIRLGFIGSFLMFVFALIQFALLFAGFNLWKSGQPTNKDNLIASLKNIVAKVKK